MKRFMQLQTLQQTRLYDMNKLGNFLMSVYYKEMTKETIEMYYLSTKVVIDTRKEMNVFLNKVLVNLTGEEELSWNLLDAMDVPLVTGEKNISYHLNFKVESRKLFLLLYLWSPGQVSFLLEL